jgi:hypothetical protein
MEKFGPFTQKFFHLFDKSQLGPIIKEGADIVFADKNVLTFIHDYVEQIKNSQDSQNPKSLQHQIRYAKEKIPSTTKLKGLKVMDVIRNSSLLTDGQNKKIMEQLGPYKYSQSDFVKSYNKLSPYDKITIMETVKKQVGPCYWDFYNAFVPLNILDELESSRIMVVCKFAEFETECSDCGCGHDKRFCINIKIPYKDPNTVHFSSAQNPQKQPAVRSLINPMVGGMGNYQTGVNLDRLETRIKFVYQKSNVLQNSAFGVHIFLSDFQKKLDFFGSPGEVLGEEQTNSAYCLRDFESIHSPITKIVVYRGEELDKISMHEMLHGLGVEGDYKNKKLSDWISGVINIDHYCKTSHCTGKEKYNEEHITNVNEGYVDFCADFLNILLYCAEISQSNSVDSMKQLFIRLLTAEVNFASF